MTGTTIKKTTKRAKAEPKTAASDLQADDTGVEAAPAGNELDKRELIAKVVERSGVKRRDAKPAVEAMLAILGETLAEGRELKLPPFGRLKVNRIKQMGDKRVIITKLRQGTAPAERPAAGDETATAAE
ncbi:HU family DNA-binding protein [Salipiger sp.]|uniref:HU family DNA-binding protein n=1 Tax=Salipiger sp. TaxID=2078585 RepID=UPI003A96DA95